MTVDTHTAGVCLNCGTDTLPAMARCRQCGVVLNSDVSRRSAPSNGKQLDVLKSSGSSFDLDSGRSNPTFELNTGPSQSSFDLDAMCHDAGVELEQARSAAQPPQPDPSAHREPGGNPHPARDSTPAKPESASGDDSLTCTECGRSTGVPPSLIGKRVKCPGCGAQLPVPGTPTDEQPGTRDEQPEYSLEEVRHQLQAAVTAALRAAPPPAAESPSENTVSRRDLRRLKRALAQIRSGTPSFAQLDATETAIRQVGSVPDPRVGALLREQLDQLPPALSLVALGVLAERRDPAAFEPTMRALADADEHALPGLLQICGLMNDPRVLQPLLIVAARFPRHRTNAVDVLRNLGAAALSPLVRAAVTTGPGTDDEIRSAAIEVLEHIADPRTIPRLSKLVQDANPGVRLRAVKALSAIENDSILRPLVASLSDADAKVRAAAAAALARRPHPKLAPRLAKALSDPDRQVRLHAAKGLGLCENPAVAPQLRPLLSCGDEELELAAAESTARLGDQQVVPDMLDLLNCELQNPGTVPGAETIIDALRRLKDDRALLPLVEMLRHPRDTIRARAAEALGQIGDPAAVEALIDLLQREFSQKVQAAAAKALGELRDPQAVPALENALQHASLVRCKALIALGEIGGRRALRSLIELTKDPAPTVRFHAAKTLARTGDRSALAALEPLTLDSDEMVRRSAFTALQELGDDRSEDEIRNSVSRSAPPNTQATRPPRFSLSQHLPDVVLGLGSRKTGIYAAGFLVAAGLLALLIWAWSNWQSDTVVIRGFVADVSIGGNSEAAAVTRTLGLFEIWDVARARTTHQSPDLRFTDVFVAPDGSSLLGLSGNSLTLMQLDADHQVTSQVPFQAPGEAITAVGTSPSGTRVATVSNTGELVCWNIQTGAGEWTLQIPAGQPQGLAVTEGGDRAAALTNSGDLLVWDVETGELAAEFHCAGTPPRIRSLSFDTTGELLAASSSTGVLYVWDTNDLRQPQVKPGQGGAADILRFVDADRLLVLRGNSLESWSLTSDQPRTISIDADLEGSLVAAASSDGSRVVIGADESSTLFVYDVASGKMQSRLFEQ